MIRAIGPLVAASGVANPLPDPGLELHDGNGSVLAVNDDQKQGHGAALRAVHLAPSSDQEAAIFTQLAAGAYTAVVRGKDGATGTDLVEVYNLR